MVDQQPAPAQFRRDAPVAIPTPMCDGDLLNGRPHRHLFFHGLVRPQRPIETRPADLRQTDTSARYSTGLASTSRPGSGRRCLRASCSAPLASRLDCVQGPFEKIHLQDLLGQHPLESADLFPERRLARIRWRCPRRTPRGSSFSRHVYNSRRLMPSSFASATMLSHCVSRSTAICRKAFGNFPTRFLATCHPLCVPSVPIRRVSI